ncbi:MAG: hypothetical protein ACRBCK_12580 [Alphaproteobacteria bacterium]
MPESARDAHGHFVIQRRNLILISIFAIFYKVGKLEVKEIKFFGNYTDIGDPAVVTLALYSIYFYFLWRYYTAARGVSAWAEFVQSGRIWVDTKCQGIAKHKWLEGYDSINSGVFIRGRTWFSLDVEGDVNEKKGAFDTSSKTSFGPVQEQMTFSAEIWHWRVWSYIHAIITRAAFSDYVFPYILASIALLELLDFKFIMHLTLLFK